jgi:hypothetical protein
VNCVPEFCDTANFGFPRREGEIAEGVLWVERTPERSWKSELSSSGQCEKEGLGVSRLDREGRDLFPSQMKSNFEKPREVFLRNGMKKKKLSLFLHRFHEHGESKTYPRPIVSIFHFPVGVLILQEVFQ